MTEAKAAELQALRPGAKVIGISADVRNITSMEAAVGRTVSELGKIDYVMWGFPGVCYYRHKAYTAAFQMWRSWKLSRYHPESLGKRL